MFCISAVTMKDDILTAVADFGGNPPPGSGSQNVAPVAPLPSRLSFCLSPQRQQQLDAMMTTSSCGGSTTAAASAGITAAAADYGQKKNVEATAAAATSTIVDILEIEDVSKEDISLVISPTKKLLNCNGGGLDTMTGSGCSLSTMVAVKRSPTVRLS